MIIFFKDFLISADTWDDAW